MRRGFEDLAVDVSGLLNRLRGGNPRSLGSADQVAAEVIQRPGLFPKLFEGLTDPDESVRMRASDAAEKVSRVHPEVLVPLKERLLGEVASIHQDSVRWHAAQMIDRLELDTSELERAFGLLEQWATASRSRIVQACALEAMADLAERNGGLVGRVRPLLEMARHSDVPSLASRGRRLLKRPAFAQRSNSQ